jgi:hypothetical protein
LAANHVLVQRAQVVNHLTFHQMAIVHNVPIIVKAVTFGMSVLHVSQIVMVYMQDVLSNVIVIVYIVNAMMILDIVHNVSRENMVYNVNLTVVIVLTNVVIYVLARMVVEMDIMSIKSVSKQYVKPVRQIVNIVRIRKHVCFAIMVFTSLSLVTLFTVCHVSKNCNVRTV